MNSASETYIKSVIESILFISEKPVPLENLKEVVGSVGATEIRRQIQELMQEYEDHKRGMIIREIAGGYQMLSNPLYASHVRSFFKKHVKEKLSRPALETLSIIAYKQPVTRGDIELIRGVNSDGVTELLVNKGLIKIVGRKDIPGRPYLFGTTKLFLEYFGLKSLQDMPRLEEVPGLLGPDEPESVALHSRHSLEQPGDEQVSHEARTEAVPVAASETVGDRSQEALKKSDAEAATETEQSDQHPETPQATSNMAMEDVVELKQAMDGLNRGENEASVSNTKQQDFSSSTD